MHTNLKYILVFFLFLNQSKAQNQRPNIVLFMVDDMGWQDTSVPFWKELTENNRKYKTPNMERLAAKGLKFTQAYATPVCTPTRVSLISGMNAARHGVTNWTSPLNGVDTDGHDVELGLQEWNMAGCSPMAGVKNTKHITALPQLLKDNGYFTVHAGKAHWGALGTPAADPKNLGFVVNIGGAATGHPESYHGEDNYGNKAPYSTHAVPDMEAYFGSSTFLNGAITHDALKALDYPLAQDLPFFLYLSHYAVHTPIMADSAFVQKYRDRAYTPEEANYASLVESMDHSLGQVLDFLDDQQIDDETIVIFMSDNGGLGIEHPAGSRAKHDNAPLKSGKGSVYEGGIREPMLVYWPNVMQQAGVCEEPVIIEDFFPTILDMAGVKKYETVQKVDGISFVDLLKKPVQTKNRELLWYYPHNWKGAEGPGIDYYAALRKGNYKLVWDMKGQKLSLFDLSKDISESNDLSDQLQGKVKELAIGMQTLLDERKAPVLRYKASGEPVRVPY